jgi:hypothetical protein
LILKIETQGQPIQIQFVPALRAHRGKLLAGKGPGVAVHAGTFLRKRQIILDTSLLASPRELARILIHELCHFVWLRLANSSRRSYEELVGGEIRQGAGGELGWSAEWRKQALTGPDRRARTRRWREYVAESFCDTAAWLYSGSRRHVEVTLAEPFRRQRRAWFRRAQKLKRISL